MYIAVLVSSSCSTDETVVADSDTEVETATSAHASEAICDGNNVEYVKIEESDSGDDSRTLDKRKHEKMEAPVDDVSTGFYEIKHEKADTVLDDVSVRSDTHATSYKDGSGGIKIKKDKVDDYENGYSVILYSQDLVVRDINIHTNTGTAPNSSVPNFKRFRKVHFGTIFVAYHANI